VASQASCPAGVLVLPDFYKLVNRKSSGFRFLPLDSLMFVVLVTVQLPLSLVKCICWTLARERLRNELFDVCLNACFCFIAADPPTSDAVNHYAPLPACWSKVSARSD